MNKSSQQNIKQTKKDPKYECIDEQGKIKYYNTLREIATDTGLDIGAISRFLVSNPYINLTIASLFKLLLEAILSNV